MLRVIPREVNKDTQTKKMTNAESESYIDPMPRERRIQDIESRIASLEAMLQKPNLDENRKGKVLELIEDEKKKLEWYKNN